MPGLFDAGEGHHQGEECRAREMKIRQQLISPPKLKPGRDEQVRPAGEHPSSRKRLYGAHHSRSHRQHGPSRSDPLPGSRAYLIALRVDRVRLNDSAVDRAKRVKPNMERDTLDFEPLDESGGEMEPCRRSSGRAGRGGEDRLIAIGIRKRLANVGRQRRLTGGRTLQPQSPSSLA